MSTKITPEMYKNTGGTQCPNCLSKDIEAIDNDFDGDKVYSAVNCNTCKSFWTDVFTLEGYINLEVSKQ